MLFSSQLFIFGFLPILLFLYYGFFRTTAQRNVLLTCASLLFYAWGEPTFVVIMIFSIMINWVFGYLLCIFLSKNIRRIVLVFAIVTNLSLLVYYKYLSFIIQNINIFFSVEIPHREIALPIGISFFTFQAMSYVLDVYRGDEEAQRNPLNLALYISLFPQLIAGPIVRYGTVARQIQHRTENLNLCATGAKRFISGLAKKVLLANTLGVTVDHAFECVGTSEMTILFAWLGAICYSLQIYFDFSGYSDMAIGLGMMFGFHFSENFNLPYISKSISEFWRRWHISLGTWFRDYLYFPLGGSRTSMPRCVLNLCIVWLLTGIWHGANWTFIIWGIWHLSFIVFEKYTRIPYRFSHFAHQTFYRVITLVAVMLGWVIFRSPTIQIALEYLCSMSGIGVDKLVNDVTVLYLKEILVTLLVAIIVASSAIKNLSQYICKKVDRNAVLRLICCIGYDVWLLLLFLVSVSHLVKGAYNPFIYFNF